MKRTLKVTMLALVVSVFGWSPATTSAGEADEIAIVSNPDFYWYEKHFVADLVDRYNRLYKLYDLADDFSDAVDSIREKASETNGEAKEFLFDHADLMRAREAQMVLRAREELRLLYEMHNLVKRDRLGAATKEVLDKADWDEPATYGRWQFLAALRATKLKKVLAVYEEMDEFNRPIEEQVQAAPASITTGSSPPPG